MTWGGVEYASGPFASPEGAAPATPTLNRPYVAVEAAFSTTPASASPVWVDITPDFRHGSTNRGRQRELDRYQASRFDLVLNNRLRSYDPEYSSGPWGANIRPMKRARVRATWAGVTYPIIDGYTDKWDQDFQPPREATSTLRATDGFKVLAKKTLPSSAWVAEITADSPIFWWRLNEPAGSTSVVDLINRTAAATTGSPTLGTAGLVTHDSDTAMTAANSGGSVSRDGAVTATTSVLISTYPMTLSAVVKPTGGMNAGDILTLDDGAGTLVAFLQADPFSGSAVFQVYTTTTFATATGAVNIYDGNPHLVTGVWAADGTIQVYVDGVATGAATNLTGTIRSATRLTIGGSPSISGMVGILDEAMIFTTAVSATRLAAWSSARATPWNGDSPGTRINRVLDLALWPSTQRIIDTGSSVLQAADLGQSALDHGQKASDSDFGELFMSRGGSVRFAGRTALINRPIAATFGDGGGSELPYASISYDNGDQLIRNPVTVSRNNGVAKTSTDATGVTSYLNHQYTIDGLYHNDDQLSQDAADFFVSEYKDPKTRVITLVVKPQRDPTRLWPVVLGAELGDVFTVIRRPQAIGSAISQNCEIQGIKHDIRPGEWTVTFTLSPAYTGTFLQWDVTTWDNARWYF